MAGAPARRYSAGARRAGARAAPRRPGAHGPAGAGPRGCGARGRRAAGRGDRRARGAGRPPPRRAGGARAARRWSAAARGDRGRTGDLRRRAAALPRRASGRALGLGARRGVRGGGELQDGPHRGQVAAGGRAGAGARPRRRVLRQAAGARPVLARFDGGGVDRIPAVRAGSAAAAGRSRGAGRARGAVRGVVRRPGCRAPGEPGRGPRAGARARRAGPRARGGCASWLRSGGHARRARGAAAGHAGVRSPRPRARAAARGQGGGRAGGRLAGARAVADATGHRAARGRDGRTRRRGASGRADPRAVDRAGRGEGASVPRAPPAARACPRREREDLDRTIARLEREWKDERIAAVLAGRAAAPQPVAPFELELRGGGRISSEALRGRVTVVIATEPSCFACRLEAPALAKLQQRYRGRKDVQFLVVTSDPDGIDALHGTAGFRSQIARDDGWRTVVGINSYPTHLFIDAAGREVYREGGRYREMHFVYPALIEALRRGR
nr:TlpA disulfide reductase family protein [Nannocystis pusilla]